jgi:ABC-type transport system involved in cytochrome c biogenesis permease component
MKSWSQTSGLAPYLIVAALLCASPPLHAATIFTEDFQDGTIDGWTPSGTVYANPYGVLSACDR